MKQPAKLALLIGASTLVMLVAGCAGQSTSPDTSAQTVTPPSSIEAPSGQEGDLVTDWVPPLLVSPEEKAAYYVSRLADRRFISRYGDRDNPRVWYIAAERLGEIGLPAVPLLFERLNTSDEYELMLALYALQLATQDPMLMVRTRGDYIQLTTVLDPAANADNVRIARQWWQQYSTKLN